MPQFNEKGPKTLETIINTQRRLITPPNQSYARDELENAYSKKEELWQKFCLAQRIAPRYRDASLKNLHVDKTNKKRRTAREVCKNPCNLLMSGDSGRGKTYFLHALMREFVEHRPGAIPEMRYFRALDLDADFLEEAMERKTSRHLIRKLAEVKYLFIDDWGTEKSTERGERDFLDLIDQRLNNLNYTYITSNIKADQVQAKFGMRLSSRIKEFNETHFDGKDLRELPRI